MHTAHTEQRVGEQQAGAREGDEHCTGTKLDPNQSLQPVGEQQDGHSGPTTCARACSKGRWEKEGMENTQDLSQSPQVPADCSRVSQKAAALHFSVNKVGTQLC